MTTEEVAPPAADRAEEQERLQAAVDAARARRAAAEQRIVDEEAQLRAEMSDLVAAARAEIAQLEQVHAAALAAIRSDADRRITEALAGSGSTGVGDPWTAT